MPRRTRNIGAARIPASHRPASPLCRYETTIHCITTALCKLSHITQVKAAVPLPVTISIILYCPGTQVKAVYRGIGGRMDLPSKFTSSDDHLVKGGVEWGFMSSTVDKSIARHYVDGRVNKAGCLRLPADLFRGPESPLCSRA